MLKRIFIALVFLPILLTAQYERPGSTDGQFLKIGVSPRGTAMADAYISAVTGAEGTYYNSAALARIQGTNAVFNHTVWFAGINHEFAAIAHNFGDVGAFGLSVIGLYTDEMLVRTPLQPDGTGETFYSGNYKIGLTYSRYFTDRVTVGISFSYIDMTLYKDFGASAVSLDIAAMYTADFRDFKFAMQISNFGSDITYVNEAYPLPTNFTFGASMNALEFDDNDLLMTFSATKPNDGSPLVQVGMEWNYDHLFFIRGGYRLNHDVATFSFGGGVNYMIQGIDLNVDYSYSDYNLLGVSHRFGLGITL
ncbi:MAG: PorV/PorQ family protein [Melioribacteraceae bacterium]|nr:PorV/PorQ family protein [Melioribacteraceae bacterium]MCF8353149.1 PorV/PorQ family protein [Melioribacteraceae bacterium]MCF8393151.1 PorV/PorQ family protein [Melioribacteraceae bacterium]MCF8418054.1 PorV/PorQ family protein [Melioribacteraceae bacterium]